MKILKRLDKLDEYIDNHGMFHPETFLKSVMDSLNVKIGRTSLTFDTVRKDGTLIKPEYRLDCNDIC